jgi:hypothetical protein
MLDQSQQTRVSIEHVNSSHIQAAARELRLSEVVSLGRHDHPQHPGSTDWQICLYRVGRKLVAATNGDPVWHGTEAWTVLMSEYGLSWTTVIVTISADPTSVGSQATEADLEAYRIALEDLLSREYPQYDVRVQCRGMCGGVATASSPDVQTRVQTIESSGEWRTLLPGWEAQRAEAIACLEATLVRPLSKPPDSTTALAPAWSREAAALHAVQHPEPDGPTLRIRAAWRDLSCAQSGPEVYRQVRYPGQTSWERPDADRLSRQGGVRASERRETKHCEVPVGTLVATYERSVYRGKRGRCSVSFGIVVPAEEGSADAAMVDLSHRTLRSRPVYEVTLPDGSTVDCPRG